MRQVRSIGCAIEARLAHTEGRAGSEMDATTRPARAQALQDICDRLLAATMPAHLTHNGAFAVDETGVMSWGRGTRETDKTTGKKVSTAADPDARWGYKTANYGQPDTFFGYSVFAFTRIPAFGAPRDNAPVLTELIVVTPATNDIVAPVLGAIDRMRGQGRPVTEIAADRAWSYKVASSWADQLRDRGIEHAFDLHPNDNKVADQAGMRMIAGVAHCPAMPNDLLQITRPATLTPGADRDVFVARIEDRKQYAMTNLTSPDA